MRAFRLRRSARARGGTLLLVAGAALLPSCGEDTPTDPTSLDVRVAYVSQIVGCPDKDNECYPM